MFNSVKMLFIVIFFQNHVTSDGARTERFINSLQAPHIPRNDFTHFGITHEQQAALSDEISVISATAAVHVPQAQVRTDPCIFNAILRTMTSPRATKI